VTNHIELSWSAGLIVSGLSSFSGRYLYGAYNDLHLSYLVELLHDSKCF